MDRLLRVRSAIYDHFHASQLREGHFLQPGRRDQFAQYETAMLLLQDTGEALWTHRRREFSSSAMMAYIEFWGVLQAVVIQQDALVELAASVGAPGVSGGAAWKDIRDFRNLLVGHPANKTSGPKNRGTNGPMRSFMGRQVYNPRLGRFSQPDTLGYLAGANLYAYVRADPINFTDPLGLCPWADRMRARLDGSTCVDEVVVIQPRTCPGALVYDICFENPRYDLPYPYEQYWRVDGGIATEVPALVVRNVQCQGQSIGYAVLDRSHFVGADAVGHLHPDWADPFYGPGDWQIPGRMGIPLYGFSRSNSWVIEPHNGGVTPRLLSGQWGG